MSRRHELTDLADQDLFEISLYLARKSIAGRGDYIISGKIPAKDLTVADRLSGTEQAANTAKGVE